MCKLKELEKRLTLSFHIYMKDAWIYPFKKLNISITRPHECCEKAMCTLIRMGGWRQAGQKEKLGCDAEDSASPWGSSEIGVSPSALSQPGAPPAGLLLPVPQRKEEKIGKGTPFRWVLLEKADSWSLHHSQQLGNKSIMSKAGSEWCIVAAMILPHFLLLMFFKNNI